MIARFFLTVLAGLLMAGIVHLVVVLLAPSQSTSNSLYHIEKAKLPDRKFTPFGLGVKTGIAIASDHQFQSAICPFDLATSPLGVSSDAGISFWSLAVFDADGKNTYSLNNRLVAAEVLDLLVVNQTQLAELRGLGASELEKRIVVPTTFNRGFVVLRGFLPSQSQRAELEQFIKSAKCFDFAPDLDSLLEPNAPTDDETPEPEDQ